MQEDEIKFIEESRARANELCIQIAGLREQIKARFDIVMASSKVLTTEAQKAYQEIDSLFSKKSKLQAEVHQIENKVLTLLIPDRKNI